MIISLDHPSHWECALLLEEAAHKIRQGLPSGMLVDSDGKICGYFIKGGERCSDSSQS